MAERELRPGEVLFHIGEESDDVYIVLDGDFDVIAPTTTGEVVVGALGSDDVVGEITAVIGGRRTATVTARTDARVSVLNGGAFEDWLAQNPDRAERLAVEARTRIDRTRVTRVVAELVGTENPEIIEALTDAVEWVTISAGSALFRQGDPSDAAYILVGGQMRVVATSHGETILDTRIGRGDLIGEMGVIEQAPRSASAIALRDCTLARIPKAAFERLTSQYPALMLPLVRTVIARVGDRSRHKPHAGTIAVVVTAPRAPSNLATELATEIDRFGDAVHLDARKVETFLNRRGIAQATRGSAAEVRLNEFLHEVDVAHRWVVLECDDPTSDWGRRAIRTADRIVVVASARPSAEERSAIDRVRTVVDSMGEHDLWAVQLNPPGTTRAVGAVQLRERTGADRVLHLREDDSASVRRLARLVSGNGTAIAFSGGGARSYGQIGALRAMHELGIEIDAVAGTSMGAVIGAFVAAVDDAALALDTAPKEFDGAKFLDYTLPITSIFRAKVVTDAVQRVFSPMQIEDTLIPFCACRPTCPRPNWSNTAGATSPMRSGRACRCPASSRRSRWATTCSSTAACSRICRRGPCGPTRASRR